MPAMDERLEDIFTHLTHRRLQLLAAVADGYSLRQVAESLGIEKSSAESQVAELRNLVDVRSTRDLARWWRDARELYLAWVERETGGTPEKPPV
jgi:DNA-binding NarL/FixJ family response regulator